MNANQQKLNLTTMHTTTQVKGNKRTTAKWIYFLKEIKDEAGIGNITSITYYARKHNVSNQWSKFLINKNILYKTNEGVYTWNEKIPISKNLIEQFRIHQLKENHRFYINKSEIKQPKKVIKVDSKIVRVNYTNTNTQELGLIRKFLKWIY